MQKQCAWLLLFLVLLAGCSRTRYRQKADADTYAVLHEKVAESAWHLPSDYDLQPRPDSRLFDPSFVDDPSLPDPSPQLYAYQLPQLPERDPTRFSGGTGPSTEHIAQDRQSSGRVTRMPLPNIALASFQENSGESAHLAARNWPHQPTEPILGPPQATNSAIDCISSNSESNPTEEQKKAWKEDWLGIPVNCRTRMLEFESVRNEYQKMIGHDPEPNELDQSPRFALEDIIDTALLNSRDYQTQKETLYSVAMRLSLERFAYDSKFSSGGTRTDYSHDRNLGATVNGLDISPTNVEANKVLTTGADLLARFSNSIVMTFNGPSGFAADVGSDLLLDISQTVFQWDKRFEGLTQSEREVVYAARSFRRFRKTQFSDLTTQYYNLLINYREIEIQSHNYFSLEREFQERSAESKEAGSVPLFQVDQVEQNALSGLSDLINQCNSLERSLDNLKIRLGLPTETPINLDLTELERLTRRDELAVTGELIARIQKRFEAANDETNPQQRTREQLLGFRMQMLSSGINLLETILKVRDLQSKLKIPTTDTRPLKLQLLRMRTDELWLAAEDAGWSLLFPKQNSSTGGFMGFAFVTMGVPVAKDRNPNQIALLQLARDLIEVFANLQCLQLGYAKNTLANKSLLDQQQRYGELEKVAASLRLEVTTMDESVDAMYKNREFGELVLKLQQMTTLLIEHVQVSRELDEMCGMTRASISLASVESEVDELQLLGKEIQLSVGGGLIPLNMEIDDAMLTGLVKRLDLITERNQVADKWRQIKLAADDLKSVLNIKSSQTVSTRAGVNRAFDFTFDESQTTVSATLDLPFNRRSERNAFRQRLIDYQAALRSQMELEDDIKLDIRDGLRSLTLKKEQYAISVAGAALAYQQVTSTELELRNNVPGVFSRDYLAAQNAYTSRLSSVAKGHIGYILDRMQLFLDLELLEVDDNGFWNELYDEGYQPEGYYQLPPEAMPAYGELPHGLMFSKEMRRMLWVPVGAAMVHGTVEELESVPAEPNAIDYPDLGEALPILPLSPATDLELPSPTVDE